MIAMKIFQNSLYIYIYIISLKSTRRYKKVFRISMNFMANVASDDVNLSAVAQVGAAEVAGHARDPHTGALGAT